MLNTMGRGGREFNMSAKSIDSGQTARFALADPSRNFLLFGKFSVLLETSDTS